MQIDGELTESEAEKMAVDDIKKRYAGMIEYKQEKLF